MKTVSRKLTRILHLSRNYSAIFVICGICSITRKSRREKQIVLINYDVDVAVNAVIDDYYSLLVAAHELTAHHNLPYYGH